jgi:20S proteasome alpha/beta subunit
MTWQYDQDVLTRLTSCLTAAGKGASPALPQGMLMHGTTIGAILVEGRKRALAFSDGKVSLANEPVHMAYRKMMAIDSHSVLLFSGSPVLAVQYGRVLRSWIGYRQDTTNEQMNARAKELTLESLLLRGLSLAGAGILLAPILVTFDHQKGCVRLFNFGPDGSMTEHQDVAASGSGHSVRILLKESWREAGTLDEAIVLARKLIAQNIPNEIDSFSGGKISMDVVGPDGVTTIQE